MATYHSLPDGVGCQDFQLLMKFKTVTHLNAAYPVDC